MNIPDELLPVIEWWEKDGKKHLAIAGVAGVAALACWGWMEHRKSRRAEAQAILATATDADTLEAAVKAHGGGECGDALRRKLASAYLARGDEGDAEKALALYEGDDGSALCGRARCLEALERWPEAVAAYKAALAALDAKSYLAPGARLGLARATSQAEGRQAAIAQLEEYKKSLPEDSDEIAAIDATIDLIKRWTKREPVAPPPPAPEAKPADEAAKAEAPKAEALKVEAPKTEAPKSSAAPATPAAKPATPAAKPAAPAAAKPAAPAKAK